MVYEIYSDDDIEAAYQVGKGRLDLNSVYLIGIGFLFEIMI